MRMVPPLRGVWASAVAASASPNPATIAIFLNIMFSPTVQACPDQRVDHSQHIKRKVLICMQRGRDRALRNFFDPTSSLTPDLCGAQTIWIREDRSARDRNCRHNSVVVVRSVSLCRIGGCFGAWEVLELCDHPVLSGLTRAGGRHPASTFRSRPDRRHLVSMRRRAETCCARQT